MSDVIFPFFETLSIVHSKIQNIAYHQARYQQTLTEYYSSKANILRLEKNIHIPTALLAWPLLRCKLFYNDTQVVTQFYPYQRKEYRTFQPVFADTLDYHLKYTDRHSLNTLLKQKGQCDEIMIIQHGLVTDSSIGNLVFRKNQHWYTPKKPLLAGTMRAMLLQQQKITTKEIRFENVADFDEIRLINALNPLVIETE